MTRFENIIILDAEQMAKIIIEHNITDEFCKSDCVECNRAEGECLHDLECCINWLNEEVEK